MAKRKTPKAEKVVDLAPKAEKVTTEQLQKIRSIVDRINSTQLNIGQLEARKHQLLHQIAGTNDELALIQNELQEQYGTNDISIMDGTINYPKKMAKLIRKISVGKDYKNDAMHYAVGQEVYGGHTICNILEEDDKFSIYIKKNQEVLPWKDFNKNMAISVEYNLEY